MTLDPLPLPLSDAIASAELSRAQVATAVGVEPAAVWKWESSAEIYAGRSPSYRQLYALWRVLCLSPVGLVRLVAWFASRERPERRKPRARS